MLVLTDSSSKALVSFSNQTLKDVSQNYNIELLENFQAVTKQDVLDSLRTHFLPLFNPSSSVAIVVTAPGKTEEIGKGLSAAGFAVEYQSLQIDPDEDDQSEMDEEEDSEEER